MNTAINSSPQTLTLQSPQTVRCSCQNCDFVGDTPDVKCPRCGEIPLLSLSKLKYRGAIKIGRGILSVTVLGAMPFTVGNFSLFGEFSFISELFRGNTAALMLVVWSAFVVLLGGGSEIVAGCWLILRAKPNRTINKLNLILYALYIVTALAFVFYGKING